MYHVYLYAVDIHIHTYPSILLEHILKAKTSLVHLVSSEGLTTVPCILWGHNKYLLNCSCHCCHFSSQDEIKVTLVSEPAQALPSLWNSAFCGNQGDVAGCSCFSHHLEWNHLNSANLGGAGSERSRHSRNCWPLITSMAGAVLLKLVLSPGSILIPPDLRLSEGRPPVLGSTPRNKKTTWMQWNRHTQQMSYDRIIFILNTER